MSDPYREDKTPLIIEFSKTQEGGLVAVSEIPPVSREELEEISNKAIDKAMTIIQETAQKVNSAIKNIGGGDDDRRPDHVEVDFGIRCDTENGVMISKALNESTFNVRLTWNNSGK